VAPNTEKVIPAMLKKQFTKLGLKSSTPSIGGLSFDTAFWISRGRALSAYSGTTKYEQHNRETSGLHFWSCIWPSLLGNNFPFHNAARTAAEDGNHHRMSSILGYFRYRVKSCDSTLRCFTHRALSVE